MSATRPRRRPKSTASFEDGDEPDRCRAKSRSGERCRKPKAHGYEVCNLHGAKGGGPIKHGRCSYRLGRLQAAFDASMEDSEGLWDLTKTLGLVQLLVADRAERAGQGESKAFRGRVAGLTGDLRVAIPQDEGDDVDDHLAREALLRLEEAVTEDAEQERAVEELATAAERLATRQEAAWKVRLGQAQAINARDLVTYLARLQDIIQSECDAATGSRILGRLDAEIMGPSAVAGVPGAIDVHGGAVP